MVLWSPVQLPSDQAYVRFDSKARKTGLGNFGHYFHIHENLSQLRISQVA